MAGTERRVTGVRTVVEVAPLSTEFVSSTTTLEPSAVSFVQSSAALAQREFVNSTTAVAAQQIDFVLSVSELDGALQAAYVISAASVSMAQQDHIKSSTTILLITEEFVSSTTTLNITQFVSSTTTLEASASDHIKSDTQIQISAVSFVQSSAALAQREFVNSTTAVAAQQIDFVSGMGELDGALQAAYVISAALVHIVQQSHVKSSTALDGELFYSFTRASASLSLTARESVTGGADLATFPLQDSFSVVVGGRFFFGDTYTIVRESTDSFLLDAFSVVETAEFASGFVDDFRVMSEATQQALNADVQIITIEVS